MISLKRNRALAAMSALAVACSFAVAAPVHAQQPKPKPHNWIQRHPTMTGIGAGVATHHMLKVDAARKKARGQRLNWADRHPTLSAIGVGATTRHIIKKHTH